MGFGSGLRDGRKNVMGGLDGSGEFGPMGYNGV